MHEQKNVPPALSLSISLPPLDLSLRDQNSNAFARCVLLSFISLLVCVCMRIVSSRVLLCISSSVLGLFSLSLSLCWTNKKPHSRFCASLKTIAFLVCVFLSLSISFHAKIKQFSFLVYFDVFIHSVGKAVVYLSLLSWMYFLRLSCHRGCSIGSCRRNSKELIPSSPIQPAVNKHQENTKRDDY